MVIKSKPILVKFLIAFKFSTTLLGFSGGSDGKESASNVGDLDSVPGLGRSAGEGMATHSTPLQYSCLEISKDRGAWWTTVHGVAKNLM